MPRLGDKVEVGKAPRKGAPPVVFAVQPDSFFVIQSPDELKNWEADLKKFLGIQGSVGQLVGAGTESCSAGCSDDCDMC
jgi:hypothetical protein